MQDTTISRLIQAHRRTSLAENLGCSPENIIPSPQCDKIFDVGAREYLVVTEQEAADIIAEQVEQELWAFQPKFIIQHTFLHEGITFDDDEYRAIVQGLAAIQDRLMEKCNSMLKGLIDVTCGMPFFIEEAVTHQGRGHFLAPYDEHEEQQGDFYIYRMN